VAANEITFKVKVEKDGNLKVIAKDSEAAAQGTEKLGKETDKLSKKRSGYQKVEKGVGQAGLSTAKGFSKQAGAISSGLVPAYAVLAANIFAITAAFNALKEAAQVKALEEGFAALGNEVGRTSTLMADKLVEITDGALSMSDALRASAAGFSAGFSMTEMEGLAEIARGASIALGRDLGDALDRLVRGTAKLEPEILDELGIFVRLDDAVEAYALTLGKTAEQLSQTEQRQAFLNAALLQGERKFAAVTDIDVNPFNKLAASAKNLAENFLRIVNVAIVPFIDLLSKNSLILIGVLTLFARTVATQMVPALFQMGEAQRDSAKEALEGSQAAKTAQDEAIKGHEKQIRTTKTAMGEQTKFAKLQKRMGTSKERKGDREAMLKSLKRSSAIRLKTINDETKQTSDAYKREKQEIDDLIEKLEELEQARKGAGPLGEDLSIRQGLADAEDNLADSMEKVNKAGMFGGFVEAWKGTKQYTNEVHEASGKNKKAAGVAGFLASKLKWLPKLFTGASVGARLFGLALLNMIPIVGQILTVVGFLISIFSKWLGKTTEASAAMDTVNEITSTMPDKYEQLSKTMAKSEVRAAKLGTEMQRSAELGFRAGKKYQVLNGVLNETEEAFAMMAIAIESGNITAADKVKYVWDKAVEKIMWVWDGFVEGVKKTWDVLTGWIDLDIFPTDEDVATNLIQEAYLNPLQKLEQLDPKGLKKIMDTLDLSDLGDTGGPITSVTDLRERILSLAKAQAKSSNQADINAKTMEIVRNVLSQTTTASEGLVKSTVGVTKAFEEANEKVKGFFSSLRGKDKFLGLANDASALKDELKLIDITSEEGLGTLNNIKTTTGQWLKSFVDAANLDWDTAGPEQLADVLENVSTKAKAIATAQENAALHAKHYAAQLAEAKAQFKKLEASFKLLDFIDTQNVFNKTLKTAEQQQKRQNALKTAELKLQKDIHDDKKRMLQYEMKIQRLNAELLLTEAVVGSEQHRILTEQIDLINKIEDARERTLDTENKIAKALINQKYYKKDVTRNQQAVAGASSGTMTDRVMAAGQLGGPPQLNKEEFQQAKVDEWMAAGHQEPLLQEDIDSSFDAAQKMTDLKYLGQVIGVTKGLMSSLGETLKGLGPDGELVLAIQAGTFTMTEGVISLNTALLATEDKMLQGAAAAATVASTIAATSQIMMAASNARVAGIDKEIAAEQKRDGKSKESLAKIKALEKKKEAEKRKAFEQNKKMMMAQTVANTAAAIMATMAHDGWWALPLAIMIGAMGAAQLAIIAGTSYSGGGSMGDVNAGPSKITTGKRRENVDISKSQNAGGELDYFRGAQGTGGPENFRGAFYGRKHRAYGGNAGYIVGEQGPELFMPDRPGTIVPADDTAEIGGGAGIVNFNINTIDATGVEAVLEEQQGNIIGMLRQAANSYGEEFMEDIDESIYSSPVVSDGVSRR